MQERKFLTLTLKRVPLTRQQVVRLRNCFTRLRHRKFFGARGGIYQIEIGQLDDLGMCNLHLHCIMDSPYIAQRDISVAWKQITGDSFIVDIQASDNPRKGMDYLTKHLTKVPNQNVPDWQYELINDVLKGTKLIQGFGYLAKVGLSVHDKACPFCGSTGTVVAFDSERGYNWDDHRPTRSEVIAYALEIK